MKAETKEQKKILNEKWQDVKWLEERLPCLDRRTIKKMMMQGEFGTVKVLPVGRGPFGGTPLITEAGYLEFSQRGLLPISNNS